MEPRKSRGLRWLSPTEHSSYARLRWTVAIWSGLTLFWISWQLWGDGSGPRRLLAALLTVISLLRALDAVGLMRRKRALGHRE